MKSDNIVLRTLSYFIRNRAMVVGCRCAVDVSHWRSGRSMVFIYQSCSQRFRPIDHCIWLSYFSSVFLAFRFALMFCILAVCVHCICVLPLSGVIKKKNNNNKGITSLCSVKMLLMHKDFYFIFYVISK